MLISVVMAICSIFLMLFAIVTGGDIELTFNLPAAIVVIGLACLSTIGAKAANSQIKAIKYFGKSSIRAGWVAFIIGLVMVTGMINQNTLLIEFLPRSLSICLLAPLYGYALNFVATILSPED